MQRHDSTPPTVHTITLEMQRNPTDRIELKPVTWGHHHVNHNQCEHEARTQRGVFRQCRRRWVTTISGRKVCAQHAAKMRE